MWATMQPTGYYSYGRSLSGRHINVRFSCHITLQLNQVVPASLLLHANFTASILHGEIATYLKLPKSKPFPIFTNSPFWLRCVSKTRLDNRKSAPGKLKKGFIVVSLAAQAIQAVVKNAGHFFYFHLPVGRGGNHECKNYGAIQGFSSRCDIADSIYCFLHFVTSFQLVF